MIVRNRTRFGYKYDHDIYVGGQFCEFGTWDFYEVDPSLLVGLICNRTQMEWNSLRERRRDL